ncbi:hypothetical protein HK096_007359 [Nowakowskiella sp. JEL0078]|nr:hypothetical protein HK096_007359 [Nowakowskiella sp. JEL0078]
MPLLSKRFSSENSIHAKEMLSDLSYLENVTHSMVLLNHPKWMQNAKNDLRRVSSVGDLVNFLGFVTRNYGRLVQPFTDLWKFRKIKHNRLLQLKENYTNQLAQHQHYRQEIFEKAIDELTRLIHRDTVALREFDIYSPIADSFPLSDEKRSPGDSAYRDLQLRISPAISPKIYEKQISESPLKQIPVESILNTVPENYEDFFDDYFPEMEPKQEDEKTIRTTSTSRDSYLTIDSSNTVTYQRLGMRNNSKNSTRTVISRSEAEKWDTTEDSKSQLNTKSKIEKKKALNLNEATNLNYENSSSEEPKSDFQKQSSLSHSVNIESSNEIMETKKNVLKSWTILKDLQQISYQQSSSGENFGKIPIFRKSETSESPLSGTPVSASTWSEASNDFEEDIMQWEKLGYKPEIMSAFRSSGKRHENSPNSSSIFSFGSVKTPDIFLSAQFEDFLFSETDLSSPISSNRDVGFQTPASLSNVKQELYNVQNESGISVGATQNSSEVFSSTFSFSSIPLSTEEHSNLTLEDAEFMDNVNRNILNRSMFLKLGTMNASTDMDSIPFAEGSNGSVFRDSARTLTIKAKVEESRHRRNPSASSVGSLNSNQAVNTKDLRNQLKSLSPIVINSRRNSNSSMSYRNLSPLPGSATDILREQKNISPIPKIDTRDLRSQFASKVKTSN